MLNRKTLIENLLVDFEYRPIEITLEALTKMGYAPNLLYDDNGQWAVVTDGTQPVVTGKQKLKGTMSFFCNRKDWAPTIRKALLKFLKNLKNS